MLVHVCSGPPPSTLAEKFDCPLFDEIVGIASLGIVMPVLAHVCVRFNTIFFGDDAFLFHEGMTLYERFVVGFSMWSAQAKDIFIQLRKYLSIAFANLHNGHIRHQGKGQEGGQF